MFGILILLLIVIIILSISLFLLKREIRSVQNQLVDTMNGIQKPIDLILIDRDLTRLAATINQNHSYNKQQNLEIVKKEEQLKTTISNISHDLRTPLTSIIGYLQLLQKTELSSAQSEYLDIALSRSKHLQTLIQDFYDISLVDSRPFPMELQKINLDQLLTDVVLSYANQLEEEKISPSIHFLNTTTYVMADETMLMRIVNNLVTNAIRYGSDEFHIDIHANTMIEICFRNKIKPDCTLDASRLFEKFYKSDISRNQAGTGLGLYIVKEFTEAMQGNTAAFLKDNQLVISLSFLAG